MRKLVVVATLAALALPAHVHAQSTATPAPPPIQTPGQSEPDVPAPQPSRHAHRLHLFISPSGEPFRGRDGFDAWFAQADANHDGVITAAEFQADAEHAFKLYDANHDGVIDGFELQAYERDMVPEITEFAFGAQGPGGGSDEGRGHHHNGASRHGGGNMDFDQTNERAQDVKGAGPAGASRFSLLNEPEPLLAADANVDGKITHAEWMTATARRFGQLDKDHTGQLTADKLRTPLQQR